MARLILDAGVVIAEVRGQLDLAALIRGDDVALPCVVVAEFLAGMHHTKDEVRKAQLRRFLSSLVEVTSVIDYTWDIAEHHAVLLAATRRSGRHRGNHDLIIAACARATDRVVLTRDARARFADLPGVEARVLPT